MNWSSFLRTARPNRGSWRPVATSTQLRGRARTTQCLAWLAWDHPHMPFEGTDLCIADFASDGSVSNERRVAGSEQESIFQPEWSSDGFLHFVSDRTGWSNLYVERDGGVHALTREDAELGYPQWVFDLSRYAFLADGRIACVFTRAAIDGLELLDPQSGKLERIALPYSSFSSPSIRSDGGRLVFPASSPTEPTAVIELDLDSGHSEILRHSTELELDERYISVAQPIDFPGADGLISHGFYYAPENPEYSGPADELPPLVVFVHGGPTAHVTTALDLQIQLFTSRGIAVVDLNYGGSTGYGREYRDRLRGRWGEVDVEDSAAAARYLGERGDVDPERMQITGGSAGGYTTLMAMAVRDEFASGASYFGVADLVSFHDETHKFESHYDDYLVGPWPDRERSVPRALARHARGLDLGSVAPAAGPGRQGRAAVAVRSDRRRLEAPRHPVCVHRLRRRGPRLSQGGERQARERGAPLVPGTGLGVRAGRRARAGRDREARLSPAIDSLP